MAAMLHSTDVDHFHCRKKVWLDSTVLDKAPREGDSYYSSQALPGLSRCGCVKGLGWPKYRLGILLSGMGCREYLRCEHDTHPEEKIKMKWNNESRRCSQQVYIYLSPALGCFRKMPISFTFCIYMALPLDQPEPVLDPRNTERTSSLPLATLVYYGIIEVYMHTVWLRYK